MATMQTSFDILASGAFDRQHLRVHLSEEQRKTSPEIERIIEDIWHRRLTEAQRRGKMLYPGRLCRLVDFGVRRDVLHLTLGPTGFRDLIGTNLAGPQWLRALGAAYLSNALGVHATVISADGRIAIFRRSSRVADYPNFYDVCGGHVEPDFDCVGGVPDPFRAIVREIHEEMSIAPGEITSIRCLGIARNTTTLKPDLIFSVCTSLPSSTLLRAPLDDEHAQIELIDDDIEPINAFIAQRRTSLAPAGAACLSLHAQSLAQGV